jgi:amidase
LDCAQCPERTKFRVAFTTESPIGTDVHPECVEAVRKTVRLLEKMGFEIEEKQAPAGGRETLKNYMKIGAGESAAYFVEIEKIVGRELKRTDVENNTWFIRALGDVYTAGEYAQSSKGWDEAAFSMEEFHETYDFFVTPTTACLPHKIGAFQSKLSYEIMIAVIDAFKLWKVFKSPKMLEQSIGRNFQPVPFSSLANVTGQPAMSVPLHLSQEGLPCGVQFLAGKGREDLLFQMAALLEQSELWVDVKKNPTFSS